MLYFAKCKQLVLLRNMVQKPSHLHTNLHLSTDCRVAFYAKCKLPFVSWYGTESLFTAELEQQFHR